MMLIHGNIVRNCTVKAVTQHIIGYQIPYTSSFLSKINYSEMINNNRSGHKISNSRAQKSGNLFPEFKILSFKKFKTKFENQLIATYHLDNQTKKPTFTQLTLSTFVI